MRGRRLRSVLLPCLQQSGSAKGRSILKVGSLSKPGPQIKVHGGLGPCHHHVTCLSTALSAKWALACPPESDGRGTSRAVMGSRCRHAQGQETLTRHSSEVLSQGATPARPRPGEGVQPSSHKPIHVLGLSPA